MSRPKLLNVGINLSAPTGSDSVDFDANRKPEMHRECINKVVSVAVNSLSDK